MYKLTTELPADVGPFDTSRDGATADVIDRFIARMEALYGSPARRRTHSPPLRAAARRGTARDSDGAGREKIELVLYTSPVSEKSQKALRAIRSVLAEYEGSQIKFTVCDLTSASNAEADGIIFTPTLVKLSPGPRTWIVGNLEHRDLLIDMLDVSGVQRRR